ncbi:T7SS effector LXG polymorphic toxin [Jeotgalibacillus sp. ET6]|uniref:ribonuclease YeeF family protein n=1 Tax=Jeotgalibacillus sp. ET6 TaxID=3037260 RepID=UPI0024187689|nr:T7SS effector LXG polymorphic toxin [Jeotgalibacillus sp. ET6]MDG5471985.1 T7SS effector LXG polymorphic toxin [Jeotgalibacillus sp. ET6]
MSSTVRYDAEALKETMEERVSQYQTFREQLVFLKEKMMAVSTLDEAFQGAGADAIKQFFGAQSEVVDSWIHFADLQIAFMQDVGAMGSDRELGAQTFIDLPFLEQELDSAHHRITQMISQQHEDLSGILSGINDLISLEPYSREPLELNLDDAKNKRQDTIETLEELDQALVEEYAVSEDAQTIAEALFMAMMDATGQNGEYDPVHFDSAAFETSEAYQVKGDVEKNGLEYIAHKQEQQAIREAQAKQAELDARPWYEKAWGTTVNLAGEFSGYYDYQRASTGIDPVTGEELSESQRIIAGGMAAAGFIPIVGIGGRLLKGGKALYNTGKSMDAATHGIQTFKSTRSLSALEKSEFGIYGLVSANGMSEYLTGRDMMGNELSEEQRNASLLQAAFILGGSAYALKGPGGAVQNATNPAITRHADEPVSGIQSKLIQEVPAEQTNKWWKDEMGYDQPPYKPGTSVKEVQLTETTTFVRVYDGENSNMYGGWFMKEDDVTGLTVHEIQDKFALPYTPKYLADLTLEEGTVIRNGVVNPLFGHQGGGEQFDLMGQYVGDFGNERLIGGN